MALDKRFGTMITLNNNNSTNTAQLKPSTPKKKKQNDVRKLNCSTKINLAYYCFAEIIVISHSYSIICINNVKYENGKFFLFCLIATIFFCSAEKKTIYLVK